MIKSLVPPLFSKRPYSHLVRLGALAFAGLAGLLSPSGSAVAQTVGPALSVDAGADRHAINPDIYGVAYPDPVFAKRAHIGMNRWGGDATTRYNWQIDNTNAGDDWYFMAGGKEGHAPGQDSDQMITDTKAQGAHVLLTVPIIPYIDSATSWDSSYPVSIFGQQQKVNPYVHPTINGVRTDAGNGRTPDGKPILLTDDQKLRVNIPNTPDIQKAWIAHLVQKFGPTGKGGVDVYELDNEPGGWNNTHRDVHPGLTGHDELVNLSIAYASAIKAADPTAKILGPGDFLLHYQNAGAPGDGAKEHGGLGQGTYYLQQFAAYEKAHGVRLLDYFDGHYYPLGQTGATDATRLEETRSLWDPTYLEKDWYGQWHGVINLIPNFHKWVDESYPGTKIGISEYSFGHNKELLGALIEADVLGIFGRERLDLACLFGPPKADEPAANAFYLYRNYDGQGSGFGEIAVHSVSADQGQLAVYGAVRSGDGALTVIVINKTDGDLTSALALAGFKPGAAAKAFRYSAAHLDGIVPLDDQPVTPGGFSATYPAKSITEFVIPLG